MDVFDLFAKLGLDSSEYESGLDRARGLASSVGGAISAGVTAVAGVTTAAIGAAATGVVNLTTQSVQAYADYEQLVGGINKLYGDASDTMLANAQQAYMTAAMDANTYMQTVTGFSASLLNSLDGDAEQAAAIADMAMRDIADNANTFGTMTAEELSSVYTALAKGNYTLLDNLNLGYAGSQAGMIALINDAGIFEEEIDSLDNVTFDQMIQAIHNVQTELNITGTTANEAASTISGSIGMLQGAWQNLLIGLSDENADMGSLIDNVVSSAVQVVENITPVAEQAMSGIANLIDQLAPILSERLPGMITTVLPSLLSAITSIISAVASALPEIAGVLLPQINNVIQQTLPAVLSLVPTFISIGGEIISAVIQGLVSNAGEITQAGLDVLQTLINGFSEAVNGDGISQLVDTTMQIVEMIGTFLVDNAPTLITAAVQLITELALLLTDPSNLQMLIDMALNLTIAIADGLVQSAPLLGNAVIAVIGNLLIALTNELPNILLTIGDLLGDIFLMIVGLLAGFFGQTTTDISVYFDSILNGSFEDFRTGLNMFIEDAVNLIAGMWEDIIQFFTGGTLDTTDVFNEWKENLITFFQTLATDALTWASDMIDNFVSGITSGISRVSDAVSGIADTVAGYIGFSEPEDPRSALHNFHTFAPDMIDLWNETLEDSIPNLSVGMGSMSDYVADNMPSPEEAGEISANMSGTPIVVQAYFGNEKFDEYVVDSNQRTAFVSGGRA